jgi:mannosyltransferase
VPGVVQTTPGLETPAPQSEVDRGHPSLILVMLGTVIAAAGIGLRFYCPSALWLDETISVNISRLSLSAIPAALRQDGAPPLYYVVLHYWMLAFGQGDFAVRSLSGLVSVLTLPLFYLAGKRVGGKPVGWVLFFLAATSPFLIQYATTTRMYSFMVFFSLLGFLALGWALQKPSWKRLIPLGLSTAAILYTHYWGLYLISVTGLWLLYQMWRHHRSLPCRFTLKAVRRSFIAMVLGSLLFIPWAPIFLFQSQHTGTPWSSPAGPADILKVFSDFAGITGPWAALLAFFYFALILLGVFITPLRSAVLGGHFAGNGSTNGDDSTNGHGTTHGNGDSADAPVSSDERLIAASLDQAPRQGRLRKGLLHLLDRLVGVASFGPGGAPGVPPRGSTLKVGANPVTLPIFGILTGTLIVAMGAGAAASAAFSPRYASVVIPLFLIVVAVGVIRLGDRRLVAGAIAVMSVAGLCTGYGDNSQPRSQAVQVAQILNAEAKPGDLILYCPDQLGPAVDRLLTVRVEERTFPRFIGPERVDWINYLSVIDHTNVETFAQNAVASVGANSTIWLVWNRSYTGFGHDCGNLEAWLSYFQGPGTTLISANSDFYENEILTRFPSASTASSSSTATTPGS